MCITTIFIIFLTFQIRIQVISFLVFAKFAVEMRYTALLPFLLLVSITAALHDTRPNIILIMTDDQA